MQDCALLSGATSCMPCKWAAWSCLQVKFLHERSTCMVLTCTCMPDACIRVRLLSAQLRCKLIILYARRSQVAACMHAATCMPDACIRVRLLSAQLRCKLIILYARSSQVAACMHAASCAALISQGMARAGRCWSLHTGLAPTWHAEQARQTACGWSFSDAMQAVLGHTWLQLVFPIRVEHDLPVLGSLDAHRGGQGEADQHIIKGAARQLRPGLDVELVACRPGLFSGGSQTDQTVLW